MHLLNVIGRIVRRIVCCLYRVLFGFLNDRCGRLRSLAALVLDGWQFSYQSTRWILGVTWLAGKIHPDRFSDLDMPQQVIQFFEQMYGMDNAVIQEHILSTLKGNIE